MAFQSRDQFLATASEFEDDALPVEEYKDLATWLGREDPKAIGLWQPPILPYANCIPAPHLPSGALNNNCSCFTKTFPHNRGMRTYHNFKKRTSWKIVGFKYSRDQGVRILEKAPPLFGQQS
ncbi:hypothetical protein L3X38_024153 [Prunus dulcis]|uniref:Uncharacterized protein n=1 Tax=Prunus dulcis TaxID=3755 RepID=A0AAD4VZ86_PRUDU|nr:hypothetical protein L3X38_024153 [Prunus dulcis]